MYSTRSDLEKLVALDQLIQLADDGPDAAASVDDNITEAIEGADREIDAYVGVVKPVPLDPVPLLIANLSAKIAVYNLHRRRPHLELGEWANEYGRAIKLLERISQGKLALGAADEGDQSEAQNSGQPVVVTRPPRFTDDNTWGKF